MKIQLDPYRIFKIEFENLKSFYESYNSTYELTKKIYVDKLLTKNDSFESMPDKTAFKKVKGKKNPLFFLRELVLIRLISAIEVYLIDNIKFIFIHNKEAFKTKTKIEFTHSELLNYSNISEIFNKIINKECRDLSSSGFEKIISYYRSKFDIDLGSIQPGKVILEEYHDRRHLFVHRLGKTDDYYRKKYNVLQKGLSISEHYIETAFIDIENFTKELQDVTLRYIEECFNQIINQNKVLCFSFKFKKEPPDFINENFQYWDGDQLIFLKDILKNRIDYPENKVEIILEGTHEKITAYFRLIKRILNKSSKFYDLTKIFWPENNSHKNTNVKKIKQEPSKPIIVTQETIELIKSNLPQLPLEKNIHKEIAKKLNLSNTIVSKVIRSLIYQE